MSCPLGISPAVEVEVRDAATGLPAATGATGTIEKSGYSAPLEPATQTENLVMVARGPAGRYTVSISKTGYSEWSKHDVTVSGSSACPDIVGTAFLKANLVPNP